MKLAEADFKALVEDLTGSLDKFKVGEAEKNELLTEPQPKVLSRADTTGRDGLDELNAS